MPRGDRSSRFASWAAACAVACATAAGGGCKSDLNQQLLERELRYQEDQIYQLQDELQSACARLERTSGENSSLKRQLGMNEGDSAAPRAAPARPRTDVPAPVLVPPAIEIPDTPAPGGLPTGPLVPPVLEGVPPLPGSPPQTPRTSAVPPADTDGLSLPSADAGPVRRLSHEELATDAGRATHLVVNTSQTSCLDTDGDGTSDGLAVVFEPRDADERLVAVAGPVSIAVFDAAAGTDPATGEPAPIARWDIAAEESLTRFRRTSRQRGLAFQLPWPGRPPAGEHVRVAVRLAPPEGESLEAEATVAVR